MRPAKRGQRPLWNVLARCPVGLISLFSSRSTRTREDRRETMRKHQASGVVREQSDADGSPMLLKKDANRTRTHGSGFEVPCPFSAAIAAMENRTA